MQAWEVTVLGCKHQVTGYARYARSERQDMQDKK